MWVVWKRQNSKSWNVLTFIIIRDPRTKQLIGIYRTKSTRTGSLDVWQIGTWHDIMLCSVVPGSYACAFSTQMYCSRSPQRECVGFCGHWVMMSKSLSWARTAVLVCLYSCFRMSLPPNLEGMKQPAGNYSSPQADSPTWQKGMGGRVSEVIAWGGVNRRMASDIVYVLNSQLHCLCPKHDLLIQLSLCCFKCLLPWLLYSTVHKSMASTVWLSP